jgi:hypothetical protein
MSVCLSLLCETQHIGFLFNTVPYVVFKVNEIVSGIWSLVLGSWIEEGIEEPSKHAQKRNGNNPSSLLALCRAHEQPDPGNYTQDNS